MNRYDEGTAFMPVVTDKNQLPLPVRDRYRFLAPDADTYPNLPSDWYFDFVTLKTHISNPARRYMRICGMAAEILRGDHGLLETFPHKELQNYWGTRPRYEDGTNGGYIPANSTPGASGSSSANILAVEENSNEPPPPPYSLEEKSPSPTHEGFQAAPTTPNDQQNHDVSDLANDLGRHTVGGPSSHSPTHIHMPGGFDFDSQHTSSFHASTSQTTGPPSSVLANRPSSSQSTAPLTTPPLSSCFSSPFGPSQDVGMPSIPVPQVSHGSNPHSYLFNFNTPFHWDGDFPNPQSQPPGGYDVGPSANLWDPPTSTKPQETTFQPGHQSGYVSRPPVNTATKPALPSQSSHERVGGLNSSASFNRPGGSSHNPPYQPSQSAYPGSPVSVQGTSPYSGSGFTPQQSSYPGKTHSGPSPLSNPSPLPQGYGQNQSSYHGMTSSPAPAPPERPPTRPPTSHSSPLSQGYGQHQSSYSGMTNSPASPDRPPTSHSSRPTTPYHRATPPPQVQPPLPGGYNYSGPTQPTYSGMKPSASPPPLPMYQQTGPSPYGYQPPPQQQQSTYPGHPGSHQPPPLPPRKCHYGSKIYL